ncbi:putative fatty acid methyltransferase [Usitatibacter rugosus]|uniref:Putative fatty acid methyltransferase n=1 Tax=Usitatibacter rugosus TaxID=2732067 RepID=A0A6M4GZY8_9PROT|nr:class I SAM-dependent methyltransferase [Usitatibacter rugosus]QJR11117.1 putative fatty acid methyltransferase [Usitatibacter rugosus]
MFGFDPAKRLGHVQAPVRVVLWDGRDFALSDSPSATLRVKHPGAALALRRPSLLSLAEAYIEGDIDFEGDIGAAIRTAEALSRSTGDGLFGRSGPRAALHTRRGDRQAIAHHYDVSNEFYALWLDSRMVYSCAYFHSESDTLAQAQVQKLDHICHKLRLEPGDRFLDVGCGWGALVMHAARAYGVNATGITLSENQYRLANERIRAAGLQDQCRVLLEDYRDHHGTYDRVASVGMFEHVGLKNLPTYFQCVRRLLREGGAFLNHGITTSDTGNRSLGLGAGEFIDRHIFPRGELPHLHLVVKEMSDADFEVHDVETLRPHYAKTLSHWSANFEARLAEASAASSERIARTWRLYLAGCAHAFEQRWISIHQVLATKETQPGRSEMPLTRDWMYR